MTTRRRLALLGSGAALLVLGATMVRAQESILPPGFSQPAKKAEPQRKTEPARKAEPQPKAEPAPTPVPDPVRESEVGADGGDPPTGGDVAKSAPRPAPRPTASRPVTAPIPVPGDPALAPIPETTGELKYDLPPGSRRLLTQIGPLTDGEGGLPAESFGLWGGHYVAALLRETRQPVVSRWGQILLRRALLSSMVTPAGINGADLAAERAALLLRHGEAGAARMIVQSVDHDRASAALLSIVPQTFMANADPAGLCPYVPLAGKRTNLGQWQLARGMCAAMSAEPGTAGAAIDRGRRMDGVAAIDALLAEKVLGAGTNGRRAITIQWDGVDRLTPWRFGLATATYTPMPDALREGMSRQMRGWAALAPMTPMVQRLEAAPAAARMGVLSGDAYAALLTAAALDEEAAAPVRDLASALGAASAGRTVSARLAGFDQLWADGRANGLPAYDRMVLGARAAAQLPVATADAAGETKSALIAAMLAGGYDANAARWANAVDQGSLGWGLLAVGAPAASGLVDAGDIADFAGAGAGDRPARAALLLAGLAGLGRIAPAEASEAATDLEVSLDASTRWSRAITAAAQRGETGLVVILAGVGMQGADWSRMPPAHLFHIVRALRAVGLEGEARMIAAEAVTRA